MKPRKSIRIFIYTMVFFISLRWLFNNCFHERWAKKHFLKKYPCVSELEDQICWWTMLLMLQGENYLS